METLAHSDVEHLPLRLGFSSKEPRAETLFQVGRPYQLLLVSDDACVMTLSLVALNFARLHSDRFKYWAVCGLNLRFKSRSVACSYRAMLKFCDASSGH